MFPLIGNKPSYLMRDVSRSFDRPTPRQIVEEWNTWTCGSIDWLR